MNCLDLTFHSTFQLNGQLKVSFINFCLKSSTTALLTLIYFSKVMPGHMSLMLSGALSGIRNIRNDYNLANGNGGAGNAGLKERLEDLQTKSELRMSHQRLNLNCCKTDSCTLYQLCKQYFFNYWHLNHLLMPSQRRRRAGTYGGSSACSVSLPGHTLSYPSSSCIW